jgi:hypothetical protein
MVMQLNGYTVRWLAFWLYGLLVGWLDSVLSVPIMFINLPGMVGWLDGWMVGWLPLRISEALTRPGPSFD